MVEEPKVLKEHMQSVDMGYLHPMRAVPVMVGLAGGSAVYSHLRLLEVRAN